MLTWFKKKSFSSPPSSAATSVSEPSPSLHKQERAQNRRIYVAQIRLIYASAIFAAAFLAICLRLFDLTVIQESTENEIRPAATAAASTYARANIIDRNGQILATNLATASLYANPKEIMDVGEAAEKLNQVLPELSVKDLRARLSQDRSFIWIKRNLTPEQHYRIHRLGLPGLAFQREERRIYPLGNLYSHVIGFTDVDSQGIAGIEKYYDSRLRKSGEPLQLSIDSRLQNILRDELAEAIRDFTARGGAGMILDANSGEILAMISLPDFDPHNVGSSSQDARFNRNTLGVYEMGSTFKIFNSAMALDSGKIKITDQFDASKPLRIGKHLVTDYHPENRWLSVPEIFEHSSNIGSARMALMVGTNQQKTFLQNLGLLQPPMVELPEIGAPITPSRWSEITSATVSFGYGISVTPLQMARAVAGIVNGGTLPDVTLIKRADSNKPTGNRVISEQTSVQMRQLLRLVVEAGTGQKAEVKGYYVGGKTGTSEKSSAGGYAQKKLLSSFIGTFPVQNPKYVIMAMVDEPQPNKSSFGFATAGWVAAPAVNRVISRMAPILGYPPIDHNSVSVKPDSRTVTIPPQTPRKNALRMEAVYADH